MTLGIFTTIGIIQQQSGGAATPPTGLVDAYGMTRQTLVRAGSPIQIVAYGMTRQTLVRVGDAQAVHAYGMTRMTLLRSP